MWIEEHHHDVAELDTRVRRDIEEFGWHGLSVLPEADGIYWTYSIGFWQTLAQPEVVLFGIEGEVAHQILWEVVHDIENGLQLEAEERYEVFEAGYEGVFFPVALEYYWAYLGTACRYYQSTDFGAVQCVWPDREGRLPWQEGFDEKITQPLVIESDRAQELGVDRTPLGNNEAKRNS